MISIIDKLFIAFIYCAVLSSKFHIFGFPVNGILIGSILVLYFMYILVEKKSAAISKAALLYIIVTFEFVILLAIIGILKGNNINGIMKFIMPVFVLLIIPVFKELKNAYGIEKYLFHILRAIFILSLGALIVYLLFAKTGYLNDLYGKNFYLFQVTKPDLGIRVHTVTGAFYASGLILAYYFLLAKRGLRYLLVFFIILLALYINQSFSIYFSAFLSLLFFSLLFGRRFNAGRKVNLFFGIFIIVGVLLILGGYNIPIGRQDSVDIKWEQFINASDLFYNNPILGKGLGHIYENMDIRGNRSIVLENSYITLLASTGILGFSCYLFIYLYYPIMFVLKKYKTATSIALFFSFLSILVASIGNPYLWSGSMGLFFIIFLAASLEEDNHKLYFKGLR